MTKREQRDICFGEEFMKSRGKVLDSPEKRVEAYEKFSNTVRNLLDRAGIFHEEFLSDFETNRQAFAKRYFEKKYGKNNTTKAPYIKDLKE